jgi:acetyltransferase-like isoleucine patch superfamily enzyme
MLNSKVVDSSAYKAHNEGQNPFSDSYFRKRKETLFTAIAAFIPLRFGIIARRFLYISILGKAGKALHTETGIEFHNADLIEVGDGVRIDRDVRIRNVGRCSKIRLGNRVRISRGVDIKIHSHPGGELHIDDRTTIGPYSCITGHSIKIGKSCLIAPHVGIFANNHNFEARNIFIKDQGHTYRGIVIGDDCWLGSGAKILDGVTLGRGCVVGAGAIVTKNLPDYAIAVGVPAKIVGYRGEVKPA